MWDLCVCVCMNYSSYKYPSTHCTVYTVGCSAEYLMYVIKAMFYSRVSCFTPLLPKAGPLHDCICREAPLPLKRKPTAHTEQTSNINEILPSGVGFKNLWAVSVGRHALHTPTRCPLFLNLRSLVNSFQNICAKSNPSVLSGLVHIITLCNDVWSAAELSMMNMCTPHVDMQHLYFYKIMQTHIPVLYNMYIMKTFIV